MLAEYYIIHPLELSSYHSLFYHYPICCLNHEPGNYPLPTPLTCSQSLLSQLFQSLLIYPLTFTPLTRFPDLPPHFHTDSFNSSQINFFPHQCFPVLSPSHPSFYFLVRYSFYSIYLAMTLFFYFYFFGIQYYFILTLSVQQSG